MLIAKAWIRWVRTPKQERQAAALEEALNLQALTDNSFRPWSELRQMVQQRLDATQVESCLNVGKRDLKRNQAIGQLRAARLTKDELQYRKHVLAGHLPYRQDCAICLRGGSKSRARKSRQVTADSFSLSLDIAGPFKPGCQEDEAILGRVRRFLLGVYRFPTTDQGELFWEIPPDMKLPPEEAAAADNPQRPKEIPKPTDGPAHLSLPDTDPFCEDPELISLADPCDKDLYINMERDEVPHFQAIGEAPVEEPLDPWNLYPDELLLEEGLPRVISGEDDDFAFFEDDEVDDVEDEKVDAEVLQQAEAEAVRWKKLYKSRVDGIHMQSLVFVELLRDKSQKEVLQATQRIISRIRLYQCPLTMVHSDRGGEFIGKNFRAFLQSLGIKQSTTEADSPASNGRVEAWIYQVKCAVRKKLLETALPEKFWGLAAVHSVEAIHRQQLQKVGIPVRSLIPFGTRCHVQERTWNTNSRGGGTWSSRVVPGRIVAPSVHVSRGYVILVIDDEGQERLFVSTSVCTAGQDEGHGIELEVQGLVVPHVPPNPPRRLRQRTSVPPSVNVAEGFDVSGAPLQDAALLLRDAHGESSGSVDSLLRRPEGSGLAHGPENAAEQLCPSSNQLKNGLHFYGQD